MVSSGEVKDQAPWVGRLTAQIDAAFFTEAQDLPKIQTGHEGPSQLRL